MTLRPRRSIVVLLACVLMLAVLAWAVILKPAPAPALLTAEVTRGRIEQSVIAIGKLEPKRLVGVGAQVSGRLERLGVALGDTVRKGDLIAQIDAQTQANALKTARAQLATVQAQRAQQQASLRKLQLAFERQQAMVAGEATSRAEFESARAELDAARAQVVALDAQIEQARLSVDTATVNVGYTRVSAPMDGVVVAVVTKQGQTVSAVQAAPTIVVLAQLDVMTVKAEISEADVIKVRPGQPVYFTILGDPDHRYSARLRQIEPAPESITTQVASGTLTSSNSQGNSTSSTAVYYNGLFDVVNDGRLRALMTAQVAIVLAERDNVLVIPSGALGDRSPQGRYTVRVLANGAAAPENRDVKIGLNNNVSAEVLEGLQPGERVVLGEAGDGTGNGTGTGLATPSQRPMDQAPP